MSGISGWMKDIITIIIFATFIDLLLPQSSLQRFIRVIIGLLILLAVINPIVDSFHNNRFAQLPVLQSTPQARSVTLGNADEVIYAKNAIIRDKYKKELEKQLTATISAMEGISNAKVVVELELNKNIDPGTIQKISIYLLLDQAYGGKKVTDTNGNEGKSKERDIVLQNKVKQLIVGIYGISADKIVIEKWI